MTRVLFISHTPNWVGPTFSLFQLVQGLRDRFDVAVLVPGDGPFADALRRQEVKTFSIRTLGKWGIRDMYRLMAGGRYDLVYANNTSGGCRNALIAAKLARKPFICHVRGMGRSGEWRRLGFLRFADAVVAVSAACARSVERYAGDNRVHVVHNGVEVAGARDPQRAGSRNPDSPVRDEPVVIGVAHLCPRKGQGYAVEVMARVVREFPSARLLLAGALDRDPTYVEAVRRRIQESGLAGNVSILGFRRDIPELLRGADLFLHTAEADPHPRSVIEAMAAELPVVAFDVDGVAETVVSESTGFLCPSGDVESLADAMKRLLGDLTLRRKQGEAGRRRARERFTAEASTRAVERIITATLEGSSAPFGESAQPDETARVADAGGRVARTGG